MVYVLSLLGAGFLGAVIVFFLEWYKDTRAETMQRKCAYLTDQLRYLYGPLHFFMSQNRELFAHCDRISEQYTGYFEGKQWAEAGRKSVEKQAMATIALSNKYVQRVRDNNRIVLDILQSQWYLIDDDDIEIFSTIQVHVIRDLEEFATAGAREVPLPIILNLGNVHFFTHEWASRVKEKWAAKRDELRTFTTRRTPALVRPSAGTPKAHASMTADERAMQSASHITV
jgi:hypothetical protein